MGLSAGLDFEAKLFAKPDAPRLLERNWRSPAMSPRRLPSAPTPIPTSRSKSKWRIMREILEVLEAHNHPVGIVTKSALVMRDIDILGRMAEKGLAKVALSVTTLDRKLARTMEPRAATPARRLEALRAMDEAGIPVSVMIGPVIPALNDQEIERILESAHAAGAREAGYIILRLPLEVSPIFKDWLLRHYPDRYRHVDLADPLDARWQGLRRRVGQAHEGHRPLCLADRPPLRDRRQAPRNSTPNAAGCEPTSSRRRRQAGQQLMLL
jgi:DNA repair photolyase